MAFMSASLTRGAARSASAAASRRRRPRHASKQEAARTRGGRKRVCVAVVAGFANAPTERDFAAEDGDAIDSDVRHLFVLDTNTILHNSNSVFSFGEHDVAIPITVLEELDKFKRGNEEVNYHAREFLRFLDEVSTPTPPASPSNYTRRASHAPTDAEDEDPARALVTSGLLLNSHGARLTVCLESRDHSLESTFYYDCADHRILACLKALAGQREKSRPGSRVVLVSKDANLRMKARALGFHAEDYENDVVKNVDQLYSGKRLVENVPSETINRIFESAHSRLPVTEIQSLLAADGGLSPNENCILRNCTRSALATFSMDPKQGVFSLKRIDKRSAFNIVPRNAEQTFALNLLLDTDVPLVTISGKAGTGKTLLALAAALENADRYSSIYLARPVVPLSNKSNGYLPGDITAKLDPYMQPLFDAIGVIKTANTVKRDNGVLVPGPRCSQIDRMLEDETLKVAPLAYIRGRSYHGSVLIVDEAQNLTPHEVKTIVTRAGEGTKIVLTGDIWQIDNPFVDSRSNGLSYIIERMRGQPLYGHVNLERGERSELAELASNLL